MQAVDLGSGDRVLGNEALRARQIVARQGERTLGAGHFCLSLGQRSAVGPRVDGEERGALADELAIGEVDACDRTGNLRAHFDAVAGLKATDEFIPLGDFLLQRRGNRHHGRRWCGGRSGLAAQQPPRADEREERRQREPEAPGPL